ncbi:hypothetical protein BEN74_14800 [Acinetobacter sp. WCHAc010034]|nr:hypothetical protein BEN74_14800 [Acinetobacter sp. WCHAc010034]
MAVPEAESGRQRRRARALKRHKPCRWKTAFCNKAGQLENWLALFIFRSGFFGCFLSPQLLKKAGAGQAEILSPSARDEQSYLKG